MNNENLNNEINTNINNQPSMGMNQYPNANNQPSMGMNQYPNANSQPSMGMNQYPNANNQPSMGMNQYPNVNSQLSMGMNQYPNANSQPSMGMNQYPNVNSQPNMVNGNQQKQRKSNFLNLLSKYKKLIFIILLIIIVFVILICILGKNKASKNEKVLECGLSIEMEGKEFKQIWQNYVVENGKVAKVIKSEKYNLKHPGNSDITKDDVDSYKNLCDEFDKQDCQIEVDYKKNNYAKYEITLSGQYLDELNENLVGMTDDEIIKKIKEKETEENGALNKECTLK